MQIIDRRRLSRSKTAENRARFIKRYKEAIKRSITDTFMKKKLSDSATGGGEVTVNGKTLREPVIHHGEGGQTDRVIPGNEHYSEGDKIPKPGRGYSQGNGREAGDGEDTLDDFTIVLDNKEFLDILFEDLELPRLEQTMLTSAKEVSYRHAGFTPDGNPSNLSIVKTYRNSLARRMSIRGSIEEEIETKKQQLQLVTNERDVYAIMSREAEDEELYQHFVEQANLYTNELDELQHRYENVPLFDDHDLRYRAKVKVETPTTHATMIMIMDNSGSMGEREKTIARKFFLLLYMFLRKSYEHVDILCISHTTTAKLMTEDEFFDTHDSGGTIVSSALEETEKLISGLSEAKTNIYVAQVSDGDNMDSDNEKCVELLTRSILPQTRYYAYVQVDDYHMTEDTTDPYLAKIREFGKGLWKAYQSVAEKVGHFNIKRVSHERDIYPVFRELFKKQEA